MALPARESVALSKIDTYLGRAKTVRATPQKRNDTH
jgi:hypothetical protein